MTKMKWLTFLDLYNFKKYIEKENESQALNCMKK